jgi:hypothetical protein
VSPIPAAAAAASGGAGATSGGRAASSAAAAVESSGLAQLLREVGLAVGGRAADQPQQRQRGGDKRQALTLRSIMPQLTDLADVQHWR